MEAVQNKVIDYICNDPQNPYKDYARKKTLKPESQMATLFLFASFFRMLLFPNGIAAESSDFVQSFVVLIIPFLLQPLLMPFHFLLNVLLK